MNGMANNPSKVLALLKNEAELAGTTLTLDEIAEKTGISRSGLRTQMPQWLTRYREFDHVHRQRVDKQLVYFWSEESRIPAVRGPNATPKEKKLASLKLAQIIDVDGDVVTLKDDKGRIIQGRYLK